MSAERRAARSGGAALLPSASAPRWCLVCGTEHAASARCPGEIVATGAEQRGYKVNAQTPRGMEAYGVLLAPVGDRWRARVMTFPRVIWMVPGGTATLKFVAKSAQEAERRAARFIREHCLALGYVLRDELALADVGQTAIAAVRPGIGPQFPRFHRTLPLRFGQNRPTLVARTRDISEAGMFVVTDIPHAVEQLLGVQLQLEHCAVPLRASVVWVRRVPEHDRPAGMGLKLHQPPPVYVNYVRALA